MKFMAHTALDCRDDQKVLLVKCLLDGEAYDTAWHL
jgi:hypothetical protein